MVLYKYQAARLRRAPTRKTGTKEQKMKTYTITETELKAFQKEIAKAIEEIRLAGSSCKAIDAVSEIGRIYTKHIGSQLKPVEGAA